MSDETWMTLALALARHGRGSVEPNPMVGAVIVRDGREIARGYHRKFGGPHAEIEALLAAKSAGLDVRGATIYVTLEPCCHFGKTPPCSDALIAAGLSRVVCAMLDVDERVAGKGVRQLRLAGIDVTVGVCQVEAQRMLQAYVKLRTHGRPWVICKWAQTADGCLALPPGQDRWISSAQSREQVHQLRGRCDGILVGIGTVLADDPLLTNRSPGGKQPVRVVLDRDLRLPAASQLARTAGEFPLVLACSPPAAVAGAAEFKPRGIELLGLAVGADGELDLAALLDELGRRQWTHLLVEGGQKVLESFLRVGLADELLVYVSPRLVGNTQGLPRMDIRTVAQQTPLELIGEQQAGPDRVLNYQVTRKNATR